MLRRAMSTTSTLLLALHLSVTAAMAGLIWFVQVVHYPLFSLVGRDEFVRYERDHQTLTSWVVGPLIPAEVVLAAWLLIAPPGDLGRLLPSIGIALLAMIHTSTVALQVPMHRSLSDGFDADAARRLVRTNWVRTAGWSARGLLATVMVVVAS
jgi:hypothetical protein